MAKYFTTGGFARLVRKHPATILRMVKKGKLGGLRMGRFFMVVLSEEEIRKLGLSPDEVEKEEIKFEEVIEIESG
ncbi:MAG: hypothetical protein QXP36_12300 [Conexivisphaerales archaeon]